MIPSVLITTLTSKYCCTLFCLELCIIILTHQSLTHTHTLARSDTNFIEDDEVGDWGPKPENKRHCQRLEWVDDNRINCNTFHEFDRIKALHEEWMKYVGNGDVHYVYAVHDPDVPFALKTMRRLESESSFDARNVFEMRKDALVLDEFHSNPYFVNIYGYCSLAMMSEFLPHGDVDAVATPTFDIYRAHNNKWTDDQLLHMNSMEPEFKLKVALEMAESVSYLHNHKGGTIVHSDLCISQFLFTKDGREHWNTTNQILKIGDFNLANFLKYDMKDREYCSYHSAITGGDVSTAVNEILEHFYNSNSHT